MNKVRYMAAQLPFQKHKLLLTKLSNKNNIIVFK